MILPYKRKAYYYESDRMDIVHHSNYIRWFEEARVYYLEQIGCPFNEIEKLGILSPVLSAQAKYKYPVRFSDEFEVRCRLTGFNGCQYSVEYEVYNITADKLSCTGRSEHCFTDAELRPLRLKRKYPDIYEKIKALENLSGDV